MVYVLGISKAFVSSKSQRPKKTNRKYRFCYKFDLESGKFKRVRISFVKAIYYKITFIFGLKTRMIKKLYCRDCRKYYNSYVNFWDRDIDCPNC